MPARFKSFYVIYGDEFVFIKKRKYVLKPSEAYAIVTKYGSEHVNVMKVLSLGPFRAYHMETDEKEQYFAKLSKIYGKTS